ncbi:S8 family serine peptidase [Microcoleus sp.]|uniref:S8 family serine peptidase n=1 Tax=Microcoleus sp. TaxID=44472 RepID=UPI003593ACE7
MISQKNLFISSPPAKATPKPNKINEYPVADTTSELDTTPKLPQLIQPLIGIIDTGFAADNPNIDYSQIILGKDLIDKDNNPLLQPNEGNQHGSTILEIIAGDKNKNNRQTPIWLGRATGSGNWHQSLIEFVDAAKVSKQPNAVVNLSFDLTQINPDGTQTTRHKLTETETAALQYAKDNNILIVAAAGNQGNQISALGQASTKFDNIITVGAVENKYRAAYSSYGEGLDILASGDIPETAETSTTEIKQGTSIAAAKATNTISQMWAANPSLNYQQIKNILLNTAKDIDVPDWDERTGYGILHAELAITTATVAIPTIPVLAATKLLTKPLIDADGNISNSPNPTPAKPSSRPALTNASSSQPKTSSTSTGDYNEGTTSYTTELAPNTTTNTSNSNGTTTTNTQTNSNFSNTESSWDKALVKTSSQGNSFNESTSDSTTNASTYTNKNFYQNSTENKNKSQQNYSRVKYEGTRSDQSSSNQKSRNSTNYTSPSQTTNTTADSYRNSKSESDSQYGTGYAINKGNRQDDWGSKSTNNTRYTSGNYVSASNSSTQTAGKADWTNSSNNNNYNNTHSGEETTVNKSDSTNSNSSGFSKNSSNNDNHSVINSTWDNTTNSGVAVNSNTRDTYSESNSNNQSSYDDGKTKNTGNRDTYTVNQSQQTNSSNGPSYWQNNRGKNYSVSQGNDTQFYKDGPYNNRRTTDSYSVTKSDSLSANSSGKVTSKNNQETFSDNYIQYDNEYKIDAYTTTSTGDEQTITSSRSKSSYDGTNTNSSSSSDTARTRNGQTVTVYKDGRKDETQTSSYERWWSESSTDKGVSSSTSGSETWSSTYRRSDFKGGYSWSETRSGSEVETITKGGVSTSKRIYWTWSRSGTVWDDGRNGWNESWSKSSWINDKYTSESDSKNGSFDPQKTGQINDLPQVGEAPRLNKAPKDILELNKEPKDRPQPSKDFFELPIAYDPKISEKFSDNQFAGSGAPPKNESPWDKFLAKLRRFINKLLELSRQGKQVVLEFLGALLYYYLKHNGALLQPFTDLLIPGGAQARDKLEKLLQTSKAAQAGRATADLIGILQGIAEILFGLGGTTGGGLSGNPALVAVGLGAAAHGLSLVGVSAQDISNLIVQVLQINSGDDPFQSQDAAWEAMLEEQLLDSVSEEAAKIARGHAWKDHGFEFPEIKSRGEFAEFIDSIITYPSEVKRNLRNGRTAYWHDKTGTVVIVDSLDKIDGGTAFKPTNGKQFFRDLR